jgi:hypothetical protein
MAGIFSTMIAIASVISMHEAPYWPSRLQVVEVLQLIEGKWLKLSG